LLGILSTSAVDNKEDKVATTLTKTVDEAADQVVSLIEQAQETASSAVSAVSEAVADYVPKLRLGELIGRPEEAVETSFRIGGKFIDASRDAVLGILKSLSPINDRLFGSAEAPVKPARKSA
jgi:hypothetical protein